MFLKQTTKFIFTAKMCNVFKFDPAPLNSLLTVLEFGCEIVLRTFMSKQNFFYSFSFN